jgi:hypothetical protein
VETLDTPKHLIPPRCHNRPLSTDFGLDVWRGPTQLHREPFRCGSAWTRRCPSCRVRPTLTPVPSYPTSPRDSTTSTPVMLFMGTSREYAVILTFVSLPHSRPKPNILVDDSGHARIADFGRATVTQNLDSIQTPSCQQCCTARWAAPEILNGGVYSKEADTFSFAMVMIEARHKRPAVCGAFAYYRFGLTQVFTGAIPFSGRHSVMAMLTVMQGGRPPRPTHPALTENLWTLMQRCWDNGPHLRPEISEALRVLLVRSVFHSTGDQQSLAELLSRVQ